MKKSEIILNDLGQTEEKYLNTKAPRKKGFAAVIAVSAVLAVLMIALPVISKASSPSILPPETAATAAQDERSSPAEKETKPTTDPQPDGNLTVISLQPKYCADTFSKEGKLDATFSVGSDDRMLYDGLRFFESNGKTYIAYGELLNMYEFDGEAFARTDVRSPAMAFFTSGTHDGYIYVGGDYTSSGMFRRHGLFRFDPADGTVEAFVECEERVLVLSTAVIGSKVYYSTIEATEKGDGARFCLKCADTESKEIKLLYECDKSIDSLGVYDGTLYFTVSDDLCYLTDDNTLNIIGTDGEIDNYTVDGDRIFVYRLEWFQNGDGPEIRKYCVFEYGKDGNFIRSVTETGKFFMGELRDQLTVYNGKIVAFDKDGLYLYDMAANEYEKIASFDQLIGSYVYYESFIGNALNVSKAVYDGKLYIMYGQNILEYSENGIRTLKLKVF